MKTMYAWNNQEKNFTEYVEGGEEIDEKMYDYFLGVVPPHKMFSNGFLMGEPYAHNADGKALYMKFDYLNGKFYYRGLSHE